ncbi:hypothetical protein K2Z84_21485 [Candidatus Binatia bacterium]|nr:hypothetical protein [Candidatus Binatia bacterium]
MTAETVVKRWAIGRTDTFEITRRVPFNLHCEMERLGTSEREVASRLDVDPARVRKVARERIVPFLVALDYSEALLAIAAEREVTA